MDLASIIGHISFGLVALSYLVKDIFWLRTAAILACLTAVGYDLLLPHVDFLRISWNSAFILINAVQMVILVKESRGVKFTEEELEFYETIFRNLTPVEYMKVLKVSHWHTAKPEEILIEQNQPVANVMLVHSGTVRVEINGDAKAYLHGNDFFGEMSFLTGDKASATVRAHDETRYLAWPQGELRLMLNRNPSIKFAFHSILSNDLTKKLRK
jgi:hypothetical protein